MDVTDMGMFCFKYEESSSLEIKYISASKGQTENQV